LKRCSILLKLLDINGSPYVGVFCRATENVVVLPPFIQGDVVEEFASALQVEPVRVTIGGSPINGSLMAANSHGAVVVDFIEKEELDILEKHFGNVLVIDDVYNAAGNIILCNDSRGLVHPGVSKETVSAVEDALHIELRRSRIAGIENVGSVAVATDRGVLCHPKTSERELSELKEFFGIEVGIGTVNYGTSFIGSGVVANTKGAVIGNASTGIEMGRVEWTLGFLD